jgi:hypothetical protein
MKTGSQVKPHRRGPLSNAERQRQWRARHQERLRHWRSMLQALRVTEAGSAQGVTRNDTVTRTDAGPVHQAVTRNASSRLGPVTAETIDDALIQLRQRGDRLVADYGAILVTPGLTVTETETVHTWFVKWRQRFDDHVKASRRRPSSDVTGQEVTPMKTPTRKRR